MSLCHYETGKELQYVNDKMLTMETKKPETPEIPKQSIFKPKPDS
jgi:hypothetical protein